jgi:SAM-dependent methyltransferase
MADRYSDYDRFAWVYNKHWGDFAENVVPALEGLVLQHLVPGSRILDLCCGTGQLARVLAERGFRLIGLDGSEAMLDYARKNAPGIEFITADARTFDLGRQFDAVVSTYDSLNHVMSLDELTQVFACVKRSLRDGGWFVFDLNLEAGYLTQWKGSFGIVADDHAVVVRSSYDDEEREARFDATIFRLENGWQRSDVTLTQHCYPVDDVVDALEQTAFDDVRVFACDSMRDVSEVTPESMRAFFVARAANGFTTLSTL